jgi:hypothetical protein
VRARPPVGGRAPGVVHRPPDGTIAYARTRRRSTRTSTRSTSTTTRPASTPSRCAWCCTGSSTACGSSGWTTRTPSRRTSGTG